MTTCNLPVLFATTIGMLATASAHGADLVAGASPQNAPDASTIIAHSPAAESGRQIASLASAAGITVSPPPASAGQVSRSQADSSGSADRPTTRTGANEANGGRTLPGDPLTAAVIDEGQLASMRGGADTPAPADLHVNQNNSTGTVAGNVASQLTTGSNNISDGAFSNSAGIPIVIQNSGNNVLIQNSTILNLQLSAPK